MKKTTSKVVTISDLVQWNQKNEIELSPKYQRNSVWNENAKSYLIDTIIRGLPIPPIFLRQSVDINTKSTSREIIDGQQRVRTILEYVVNENFSIKKAHNNQFGGMIYSDLDDEIKEAILEYEILTVVVLEKDDTVVYDMFARLNSNNYVLNKQEIRNSIYWGDFKVLVNRLSYSWRDFFSQFYIFNDKDFSRMKDSELINSLIILSIDGLISETPKIVEGYYKKYNESFELMEETEYKINLVMDFISKTYEYFNGQLYVFDNKNYFYTLFAVVYHQMFGIKNLSLERLNCFSEKEIFNNSFRFNKIFAEFIRKLSSNIKEKDDILSVYVNSIEFLNLHKSRTTNRNERYERVNIMNKYFLDKCNDFD